MNAVFGWKTTSKTAGVYIHFDDKDRDDMVLAAERIERTDEPEKPKTYRCSWCKHINPANVKACMNCGRIDGEEIATASEVAELQRKVDNMSKFLQAIADGDTNAMDMLKFLKKDKQ
jgi:hypothetical protein